MRAGLSLLIVVTGLSGCRLFSTTIPCVDDRDCPSDTTCHHERCATGEGEGEGEGGGEGEGDRTPCTADGDCALSQACASDVCLDRCNSDADCGADERCAVFGFINTDLLCAPGCRIDDAGNDNCGAGDICSAGTRQCVSAQPSPRGQDGLCARDVECQQPLRCFILDGETRGACTETCSDDLCFGADFETNNCCATSGLNACALDFCTEQCNDNDCPNCCFLTGFSQCLGGNCAP